MEALCPTAPNCKGNSKIVHETKSQTWQCTRKEIFHLNWQAKTFRDRRWYISLEGGSLVTLKKSAKEVTQGRQNDRRSLHKFMVRQSVVWSLSPYRLWTNRVLNQGLGDKANPCPILEQPVSENYFLNIVKK